MILGAIVVLICICSNRLSDKIGVPALVIFIAVGMLFGTDGIVHIDFNNYQLAEYICTAALISIMFYGGFSTKWSAAKPVAGKAIVLSSAGTVLTAALTCLCCYFFLRIDILESFLIGAVVSSTDAASVFSILRSKNLNLKGGLASLLEVESGSNDPFSYMLTVVALALMDGKGVGFVGPMILLQILLGLISGAVIGLGTVRILKRFDFISNGLDSIFVVAVAVMSYAVPSILGGNGFLSVYIAGIIMGNAKIRHKTSLVHFFDGITGLAQIAVFFLLGLLAFPSQLPGIFLKAMAITLVLTFLVRPAVIFLLMGKSGIREKLFVSWAGLRGASSIVFAIMASVSGAYTKNDVYHIVFCVSLLSVSVQGTLLPAVARKLKLIDDNTDVLKTFNDYQDDSSMTLMCMKVPKGHGWEHKKLSDIQLPDDTLALMVKRGTETLIPKGDTVILPGDKVILNVPSYSTGPDVKLREIIIDKEHPWKEKYIEELEMPQENLIVMIKRGDESIIPRGQTRILEGDTVVVYD